MSLLIARDSQVLAKKAADIFVESVSKAVQDHQRAAVAVSGGSGPREFFKTLADGYSSKRIPWTKVFFFWVDERCVPPNHPDSNYRLVDELLLSKVPIPKTNVHRMPGEMKSPTEAARSYENDLRTFFNLTKSPPAFDFIQLGIGEDGHTASLFPGTQALKERTHWVTANYVEKLSSNRITLTLPVLNNARTVVVLCPEAKKAQIVKDVFTASPGEERFPIKMVAPVNGAPIWLLDKESAAKLPESIRSQAAAA